MNKDSFAAEIFCPHCGQLYEVSGNDVGGNIECAGCHKKFRIENPAGACPMCGEEMRITAKRCRFCGGSLVRPAKSRTAYILLGLFFGGFGIHNFYTGHNHAGRMKILLLVIPVIGWLVSFFIIAWEICTVNADSYGNLME